MGSGKVPFSWLNDVRQIMVTGQGRLGTDATTESGLSSKGVIGTPKTPLLQWENPKTDIMQKEGAPTISLLLAKLTSQRQESGLSPGDGTRVKQSNRLTGAGLREGCWVSCTILKGFVSHCYLWSGS